jgi:hypothetical protein
MSHTLYCFWTGQNEMSEQRKYGLQTLSQTGLEVILIHPGNLKDYLVEPLHEGYQYLSEVHKADYLRTYFMHHHGGGYSDIKPASASWESSVHTFYVDSDAWILGYQEFEYGCAIIKGDPAMTQTLQNHWYDLVGNCAYVCKPRTPFTTVWYNQLIQKMDSNLEQLKQFPAKEARQVYSPHYPYPFEWTEILGQIFHPLVYQYRNHVRKTLPPPHCSNYM